SRFGTKPEGWETHAANSGSGMRVHVLPSGQARILPQVWRALLRTYHDNQRKSAYSGIDCANTQLLHRGQDLPQRKRREGRGVVGYPVGNDELPVVHQAAARVDD